MVNEPAEVWRRQIHAHVRQAGAAVPLTVLGKEVKRPAGMATTTKLRQVLADDQRFVLEGSGNSITVRSSDFAVNESKHPTAGKQRQRERMKAAYKESASAFWESLCGDAALRLRCRDRAVFEEEYRAWRRQQGAQGVRYTGSPGGILGKLSKLGHLRPSVNIDVLIFAGDGMAANEVVLWCYASHSHRLILAPESVMISNERYEILCV